MKKAREVAVVLGSGLAVFVSGGVTFVHARKGTDFSFPLMKTYNRRLLQEEE